MPRSYRRFTVDDYEIKLDGEIINKHTGRRVIGQKNNKGYLRVWIGGKLLFVHRLVATKYIANPNNLPQVNHKDGNKLNNHADNLEWVSNKQNRDHAVKNGLQIHGEQSPWAKLNKAQVDFIRSHTEYTPRELSKLFNVTPSTIRDVRRYRSWKRH